MTDAMQIIMVAMQETRKAVADLSDRIAAMERIKADDMIAQYGSDAASDVATEYPWHDHDVSNKCPVPKRRRWEHIVLQLRGEFEVDGISAEQATWTECGDRTIIRWRYTHPDPKKPNWVRVSSCPSDANCDIKRVRGKWYRRDAM